MKTINILKIITGLLAIFILAGFVLIITKLSENVAQRKSVLPKTSTFSLSFSEDISNTISCGDYLCLITDGYKTIHRRLIILDPKAGKISNVIHFTKTEDKD